MLKKLLKGCLTVAMVGAFATGAYAETTFTWAGNVQGIFKQEASKDATKDAKSISAMDFSADGDLDLTVEKAGDTWTGTAYFDFDWDADAVKVDDLYVKMSKDGLAISFGAFDPVGVGKGDDYLNGADNTYGADGNGFFIPNEQGWVMVSLSDVGLDVFLGMNADEYTMSDEDDFYLVDATGDVLTTQNGKYNSTAFGAKFDKAFGDVALALEYVSISTSTNKDSGDYVGEKSFLDGASASELALAVQYSMGNMGFTLNYVSSAFKGGFEGAKDFKQTWTEFLFDMALDDTSGVTVAYGMSTTKYDTSENSGTDIHAGYKFATGAVDHYVDYWTHTDKDKDADESATKSTLAYTMKVGF